MSYSSGAIVVPIIGNAAEHVSAVQQAWRNRLETTLAIAAGSSTQIALSVGPTLVFLSLLLGHPLDLVFSGLELTVLGLATAIFAYVSLDGESNWLQGSTPGPVPDGGTGVLRDPGHRMTRGM